MEALAPGPPLRAPGYRLKGETAGRLRHPPERGGAMSEPLDDSAVAELADLVLVALGLRVVALALYSDAEGRTPRMLVLADDLPPPAEREAFLASRTPRGSLGRAEIRLQTTVEFQH